VVRAVEESRREVQAARRSIAERAAARLREWR
jgi:hypothetical protein